MPRRLNLSATPADSGKFVASEKKLSVGFVRTSAEEDQARTAVMFIAKLAKMSLDLLALFVAHYNESKAEKIGLLAKSQFHEIVAAAKSAGLRSKGLAY